MIRLLNRSPPLLCWLLACSVILNLCCLLYIFSLDLNIAKLSSFPAIATPPETSIGRSKPSTERLIIIITPTYDRLVQKAELLRQIHTFQLIPPALHWIVVEDADSTSEKVRQILIESGISHTLLAVRTPDAHRPAENERREWLKPRGVVQRNLGIEFLRRTDTILSHEIDAVVYFADDDNTYSTELFADMRRMHRKVAVWPVAFVGGLIVERPLVENGQVIGWNAIFRPERLFALDMADFAVDVQHLRSQAHAAFSLDAPIGYQETKFFQALGIQNLNELEPLADFCRKVLVWHTKTQEVPLWAEKRLEMRGESSLHVNMSGNV